MKTAFLDKLMERLDRLDPGSVQTQFLRLSREKGLLETIFHAIQEGLIVLDGEGRIMYANTSAEQMLGFKRETVEGEPIRRYMRDVEWDLVLDLDEHEWSRLVHREIEITYPEHRFLLFYIVPLGMVNPDEEGAVMLLRDVTQERATTAHTIESERMQAITLLAAGVAHEIGNPLNSLNIHLQLLERESEQLPDHLRETYRELVDISKDEVSRLDKIINQFLRALRPSELKLEDTAIKEILEETVNFLKHEIKNRNVLVEIESAEDMPLVKADSGQLRQAFFNVIKNAMEAMSNGGLLKIYLSKTDRFVTVSFRDTGPGISLELLSTIFEPYHTSKEKGSGLGLMIVQRIMRDHGGEIEVHSEPGHGAVFTLYFPIEDVRIRLLEAPSAEKRGADV